MKISILTLFPEMFTSVFSHSIIKRAVEKNLIHITYTDIRQFGIGKHKMVDDTPYGGGAGMLLRVDVAEEAIIHTRCAQNSCKERVILLDATGQTFTQQIANTYATTYDHLILICPHYEGIDYRIYQYIDDAISLGDYVLTGGEIPAMVLTDAVVRLLPGALGKDESSTYESFQMFDKSTNSPLLEYPQYTKPTLYKGQEVPEILLSGHHKNISEWREAESILRTKKNRPDLFKK